MRNTRVSPRHRRRFKVAMEGAAAGFTVDVSLGGFCAELLRVLPPGTVVRGLIDVRGQPFPFSGQVAWAKPGDARMNLRGRMGVAFTQTPDGFSASLEARQLSGQP